MSIKKKSVTSNDELLIKRIDELSKNYEQILAKYFQMKEIATNNDIIFNRSMRFITGKLFEIDDCNSMDEIKLKTRSLLKQINQVEQEQKNSINGDQQ